VSGRSRIGSPGPRFDAQECLPFAFRWPGTAPKPTALEARRAGRCHLSFADRPAYDAHRVLARLSASTRCNILGETQGRSGRVTEGRSRGSRGGLLLKLVLAASNFTARPPGVTTIQTDAHTWAANSALLEQRRAAVVRQLRRLAIELTDLDRQLDEIEQSDR
jgi:hypothetical protein